MMSPIKLILAGLLALISACSESANQEKPVVKNNQTIKFRESTSDLAPVTPTQFVAGIAPNQRPINAPIIRELSPNAQRRSRLLTGVSEPIPASLDFIDDQGAWYTPFNQPGMPGYYDLRNWHDKARDSKQASK